MFCVSNIKNKKTNFDVLIKINNFLKIWPFDFVFMEYLQLLIASLKLLIARHLIIILLYLCIV